MPKNTKGVKKVAAKDTKKVTKKAQEKKASTSTKKVAKKTVGKASSKKPEKVTKTTAKKVTKKDTAKVTKPTTKKVAKKSTSKVAKAPAKKVTKKAETKVSKVATKKAETKKTAVKSTTKAAPKATKKGTTKAVKAKPEKVVKKTTKKNTKKVTKPVEKNNKKSLSNIVLFLGAILAIVAYVISVNLPAENEVHYDSGEQPTKEVVENDTEEIDLTISPDVNFETERKKYKNNDIIARLEIPDVFNVLVVRGTNNSYYLNRSIKKKKDNKGTEFMDYRVNSKSKQINIYGHNSKTYDIPFRKLEKFLDEDFFEENKYIVLQTDSGRRIYKIFSIKEYSSDYEYMKVDLRGQEFVNHIDIMKENSIHSRDIEYNEKSSLLVLQTCKYGEDGTYYVLSAIEMDWS